MNGDFEKDEVGEELTKELDCVKVHSIGGTLTLYRDSSLPPAPRFKTMKIDGDGDDEEDEDSGGRGKKGKKRMKVNDVPPPPPEFTIIS